MPLYFLDDLTPEIAADAWVAPSADLIGDVRLSARASVWFGAIIRADNTPIVIGEETNIQDGAIGHSDPGVPLTIGARVTVGHQAILHGCTIADDAWSAWARGSSTARRWRANAWSAPAR